MDPTYWNMTGDLLITNNTDFILDNGTFLQITGNVDVDNDPCTGVLHSSINTAAHPNVTPIGVDYTIYSARRYRTDDI